MRRFCQNDEQVAPGRLGRVAASVLKPTEPSRGATNQAKLTLNLEKMTRLDAHLYSLYMETHLV
jgi:hypothetical protein